MHEIKLPVTLHMGRINSGIGGLLVFVFVIMPLIWYRPAFDPDLNPRFLVLSVFLLGASILILRKKQIVLPSVSKSTLIVYGASLLWMFVSYLSAINPGDAITEWVRIASFGVFLLISILLIKREQIDYFKITRFVSVGVLLFSVIATGQSIPLILNYLHDEPIKFSSFLASTLSNKNFFSDVLVILFPICVFGMLKDRGKWKALHIASFIAALAYIIVLQSLSSWIALSVTCIIFFILIIKNKPELVSPKQRKGLLAAFLAMGIKGAISLFVFLGVVSDISSPLSKFGKVSTYIQHPEMLEKTSAENSNSTFDRILIWRNSFRMIKDHPVTGVGLNNWRLVNPSYGIGGTLHLDSGLLSFEHPHNDYLLVFAEQGLPGIILYLLFFILIFIKAKQLLKKLENHEARFFVFVLCLGIVSFLVASMFSYPRSRIYPELLVMLFTAFIFAMEPKEDKKEINLSAFVPVLTLVFSFFSIYVSAKRLNADLHTKNLVQSQINRNYPRMIREADKSISYYTPLDYTGMPYEWYQGMARFQSGQKEEALRLYRTAFSKNPYQIRLLNDLGTAMDNTGQKDSAVYYYQRALSYSRNCIDCRVNLATVYFNQGNVAGAFATIDSLRPITNQIVMNFKYEEALYVILANRMDDSLKTISDTSVVSKVSLFLNNRKEVLKQYRGLSDLSTPVLPELFQLAIGAKQ